jgi:hypothetical protein
MNPVNNIARCLRFSLILSSHLFVGRPSSILVSGFPTEVLYAFLLSLSLSCMLNSDDQSCPGCGLYKLLMQSGDHLCVAIHLAQWKVTRQERLNQNQYSKHDFVKKANKITQRVLITPVSYLGGPGFNFRPWIRLP